MVRPALLQAAVLDKKNLAIYCIYLLNPDNQALQEESEREAKVPVPVLLFSPTTVGLPPIGVPVEQYGWRRTMDKIYFPCLYRLRLCVWVS